jgi:hypothetical protein
MSHDNEPTKPVAQPAAQPRLFTSTSVVEAVLLSTPAMLVAAQSWCNATYFGADTIDGSQAWLEIPTGAGTRTRAQVGDYIARTASGKFFVACKALFEELYSSQSGSGADLILIERARQQRQITQEGWDAEHDSEHTDGELAQAAACYANLAADLVSHDYDCDFTDAAQYASRHDWPDSWDRAWWKPSPDPVRNLVKAGALIAAEIDRLQREQTAKQQAESESHVPTDTKPEE